VESQWKRYHEINKDIEELLGLHALNDGKVLEDALQSITGKLDQQMRYIAAWPLQISSQANSVSGLPHIPTSTDENIQITGNKQDSIAQKSDRYTSPCRTERRYYFKMWQQLMPREQYSQPQRLTAWMAELEIVHKEINELAQVQNHWWVAKQFTNSDAAATQLIKSTKRKSQR